MESPGPATKVSRVITVMILSCASVPAAEQEDSPRDDPGFDYSMLPQTYHPLKSRMALRYHLAEKGGVSAKDRVALAQAFSSLQPYEQRAVLGEEVWPLVRCPEFQPVLEAMLHLPDKAEQKRGDSLSDALMERLMDLGSSAARQLLLEDIRSGYPRLAVKGLGSLPEKDLPELDAAFRADLIKREPPLGGWPCDLFKISFVIGRYGSPALLDDVKATYSSSNGGWACDIQAGLLRYLIKHDPEYGLAKLELALSLRGQPGKNNCFGDAIHETLRGLQGKEITAFAIRQLAADHPKICYSAARYLIESDDPANRSAVIRMTLALPPRTGKHNGEYFPDLREQVLNSFLHWPTYLGTHRPSLSEINQLESNLSGVEKADYQDAIQKLRDVLHQ
jgi:hypothetical protein